MLLFTGRMLALLSLSAFICAGADRYGIGPLVQVPAEANLVLLSEKSEEDTAAFPPHLMFLQSITNFPIRGSISWLIGASVGHEGVYRRTRVAIISGSSILREWRTESNQLDSKVSPLMGVYDLGRMIMISSNLTLVGLGKFPQRGAGGIDLYLLDTTNGAPPVFSHKPLKGNKSEFAFADLDNDGIKEMLQKIGTNRTEHVWTWRWDNISRSFLRRAEIDLPTWYAETKRGALILESAAEISDGDK